VSCRVDTMYIIACLFQARMVPLHSSAPPAESTQVAVAVLWGVP
jgi:hypothetical protein